MDSTEQKVSCYLYNDNHPHLHLPIIPAANIRIQSPGRLLLDHHMFPMAYWQIQEYLDPMAEISSRLVFFPDQDESFISRPLGIAFAFRHHHYATVNMSQSRGACINTALYLALNCEVGSSHTRSRRGAYILKAVHYPLLCTKFNLMEDYPDLEYIYVARLDGSLSPGPLRMLHKNRTESEQLRDEFFDPNSFSSLGLRVAISKSADRIAMASWKRILIWAFDPSAFLDPSSIPTQCRNPEDYAYVKKCGHIYYESEELCNNMILLRPKQLESEGVVHQLVWIGENQLWAWTDKGIICWDLSTRCKGKNITYVID